MKIKIGKKGNLWLERGAGEMKTVECPYSYSPITDDFRAFCGDWCALFREERDSRVAEVILCKNRHYCAINNFTDERGK